jgi:hypothetical protein
MRSNYAVFKNDEKVIIAYITEIVLSRFRVLTSNNIALNLVSIKNARELCVCDGMIRVIAVYEEMTVHCLVC